MSQQVHPRIRMLIGDLAIDNALLSDKAGASDRMVAELQARIQAKDLADKKAKVTSDIQVHDVGATEPEAIYEQHKREANEK